MSDEKIRVRFAPSPTGELHVGNARTALFNYLYARKSGGTFILRLEDTDLERSTTEAEESILSDLRWLGLGWDEGPDRGGEHGPYRQSERQEIYRRYAAELAEKEHAYRCYCTPEELEEKRKRSLARGVPPKYDGRCRNLRPEDEEALRAAGRAPSLRFKVETRRVDFEDLIKGRMSFEGQTLGDFIIQRSDGTAPYNFAVVIDDALMQITHVIRGEDHVTNTPRQLLVYQALGWQPPKFAHPPMILGPDRSPLSKRHGATAVNHFRAEGFLPEALINYLALLGWSVEDGREILSLEELSQKFSLGRVSRSSAVFDLEKLKWVNRAHMKVLPKDRLLERTREILGNAGLEAGAVSDAWLRSAVAIFAPEVDSLRDLAERLRLFLDENISWEPEAERLLQGEENRKVFGGLEEELAGAEEITPENYKPMISALAKRVGLSGRRLYLPLRAALTGKMHGPELDKVFILLGKEKILARARAAGLRTAKENTE
jgi:nondiscriminating glutamyl-tRNA synthetase